MASGSGLPLPPSSPHKATVRPLSRRYY